MLIHAEKHMICRKINPKPSRINFAFESGNNRQKTSDAHFIRVSEVSLCLLDLFLLTEYFLCVNTEKLLHILFHSANSCNAEVLDQDLCNIRAEKCRKCRAKVDILHTKI